MGELLRFVPNREGATTLPDGTLIYIEYENKLDIDAANGDVEEHEAEHAVVAIKNGTVVHEASIIPEGNSLGHVSMGSEDLIAAATSHGRAGNGHDRRIVEQRGQSFEGNGAIAHGVIRRNKKHVRAVATALGREGRLTGNAIQRIMQKVDQGEKIRVRVVTPDGRERLFVKKVDPIEKTGMISIGELPKELPTPANSNKKELSKAA